MLTVFNRNIEPRRFANLRPWFSNLDDWLTDDWRVASRELASGQNQTPRVQVDEDDEKYTLSLEIPGVSRENITIELTANNLVVTGDRKYNGDDGSRSYSKFERNFTLPEGTKAEDISADHRDGVLRLFVKKPVAAKPVRIAVGEAQAEKSCCATKQPA
jgi:HSP20 family protein